MVFQRGLIGDSSWLWLMTVVVVLMTDCVCCKIKERRNWKISIWFFVLGVTQNQERRAGELWVKCGPRGSRSMTGARLTPAEYYQTCHKRKWRAQILSGSQDSDHDLSSPITKPGEISNSSSSREMPFIQNDAVWISIANLQPTVTLHVRCKIVTAHNSNYNYTRVRQVNLVVMILSLFACWHLP